MQRKINQSVEDYLETILILSKNLEKVRSIDIAKYMNISKPSVSVAMKKLRETEDIFVDKKGHIYLTEKGNKTATSVYEKHEFLRNFFIDLGIEPELAKNDACAIEHVISEEVFDAFKKYVNNK